MGQMSQTLAIIIGLMIILVVLGAVLWLLFPLIEKKEIMEAYNND